MSNLNKELEYYYDCKNNYHLVVELMDNSNGELFMHDFGVIYRGSAEVLCQVIANSIDTEFTLDAYRAMGIIRGMLTMEFGDEARNRIEELYEELYK